MLAANEPFNNKIVYPFIKDKCCCSVKAVVKEVSDITWALDRRRNRHYKYCMVSKKTRPLVHYAKDVWDEIPIEIRRYIFYLARYNNRLDCQLLVGQMKMKLVGYYKAYEALENEKKHLNIRLKLQEERNTELLKTNNSIRGTNKRIVEEIKHLRSEMLNQTMLNRSLYSCKKFGK